MATRHLAPIAQYREPRDTTAAAILQFLGPKDSGNGYIILATDGGRWTDAGDYIVADLDAASGLRGVTGTAGTRITIR
jgi:hypothetical protein